jgi:purine-binding chemotaxis protein CheW
MNAAAQGMGALSCQYVTFRVADLVLGIDVVKVQEVIRYQEMTVVPLAPASVEGLINLRGQIVIAIDARRSLGLPPSPAGVRPMNIVIRSSEGAVSLLVDEIHDVIDISAKTYAPVPDNMPAEQRALIECVYVLERGLMLVLNVDRVLEGASHSSLRFNKDSSEHEHSSGDASQRRFTHA